MILYQGMLLATYSTRFVRYQLLVNCFSGYLNPFYLDSA
jgi:hypothetical protein